MSEPMTIDVRVKKDDGGPVYPAPEYFDEKCIGSSAGMTVRQLYVGQIGAALAASTTTDTQMPCEKELAQMAVAIADALIEEETRTRVAVRTVSKVVDEE